MLIPEYILLLILAVFCIYASITDIQFNVIKNGQLLLVLILGLVISAFCIKQYYPDAFPIYILNIGIAVVLSVLLYATHIWAAGDSKMLIVVSALIPVRAEFSDGKVMISALIILAVAFSASFLYLLADSVALMIKTKKKPDMDTFKPKFIQYLVQYLCNLVLINIVIQIENIVVHNMEQYVLQFTVMNLCFITLITNLKIIKNRLFIGLILAVSVVLTIITGVWPISFSRIFYYIFVIVMMLFKLLIGEFNYCQVHTEDIREGMILSSLSSLYFTQSAVKGLPGISHEDMRDRLTGSEVEAIRRWQKTKQGRNELTIVKKMPFAIFISIGVLGNLIIWRILL